MITGTFASGAPRSPFFHYFFFRGSPPPLFPPVALVYYDQPFSHPVRMFFYRQFSLAINEGIMLSGTHPFIPPGPPATSLGPLVHPSSEKSIFRRGSSCPNAGVVVHVIQPPQGPLTSAETRNFSYIQCPERVPLLEPSEFFLFFLPFFPPFFFLQGIFRLLTRFTVAGDPVHPSFFGFVRRSPFLFSPPFGGEPGIQFPLLCLIVGVTTARRHTFACSPLGAPPRAPLSLCVSSPCGGPWRSRTLPSPGVGASVFVTSDT